MQKILFPAAILALLLTGCAPEAHDFADALGDPESTEDAGSSSSPTGEDGGTSSQSDAGTSESDGGSSMEPSSDASPAQGTTDAGSQQDGGTPMVDSSVAQQDGGSTADGSAAQNDAGPQQPAPTVVWSKRHTATANLGGVTTQPYHRARFTFSTNGCTLNADSPFYPTGWTGTSTITLTSAQQACLREQFDCSIKAKVQWGSCASAGCGSLSAGLNWETDRPSCSVSIPSGKALSLRVTIAQLGASGIDETWEVVTP